MPNKLFRNSNTNIILNLKIVNDWISIAFLWTVGCPGFVKKGPNIPEMKYFNLLYIKIRYVEFQSFPTLFTILTKLRHL